MSAIGLRTSAASATRALVLMSVALAFYFGFIALDRLPQPALMKRRSESPASRAAQARNRQLMRGLLVMRPAASHSAGRSSPCTTCSAG